jgi:uncharacterized protein (TIGR03435 family)
VAELIGRNRRRVLLLAAAFVALMLPAFRLGDAAQDAAAKPLLAFDVVSIKPDKSEMGPFTIGFPADGDGLAVTNIPLEYIIQFAYDFHRPDLISGVPDWAKSERYDIQAKVAAADLPQWNELSDDRRRLMVQAILVDRFKLQIHREAKEIEVYELVVGKNGSKVTEAKPGDPKGLKGPDGSVIRGMLHTGFGQYTAQETPMVELALVLSDYSGRQVIDKTGLKGTYDFKLQFTPEVGFGPEYRGAAGRAQSAAPTESSAGSIFTAVQEQLGLKLESAKQPVEGLVVDHVERAAGNR